MTNNVAIPAENDWTISNHWKFRSDAAFCGVWSGSALFASYPFRDLQYFNGLNISSK